MFAEFLWKGIVVGLLASIPLGPIGVLCIQRTLSKGRLSGFISGLGAAAADVLFAIIAGFGISIIIDSVVEYQFYLKIIGGIILFLLGIKLLFTNPAIELRKQLKNKKKGLLGDFLSIFAVMISNPVGIFIFAAVFAGFNLVAGGSTASVLFLILGVLLGASLWWFCLSSLVSIFKEKFRLRRLLIINRIAGVLIIGFGVLIIISIFVPGF